MYQDVERYRYKDNLVYVKKFQNLDQFLVEVRDNRNLNPIFQSEQSTNGDASFTETKSYEEAWNLCRFTMNQGFDRFYQKFCSLNYKMDYQEKKVDIFNVTGYVPNVPRYLLGIPTCMRSYRVEKKDETISIYMNMAYSCYQNKEQIENRGILVLNLIEYLETQGYHVNLFTYDFGTCDNEKILMIVPLKTKDEKLNIKKTYFPLVHPSFLRRLLFRAQEKMPVQRKMWAYGYGSPVEYEEAVKFFDLYHREFDKEKIIYISTPNEMGIKGQNLEEDFDHFLETINRNYQNREKAKQKVK